MFGRRKFKNILETRLEEIRPSKEEVKMLHALAKNFIDSLKKKKINGYIGGSLAKGTLLKGEEGKKQDIDIFVVFEEKKGLEKLEALLKKMKLPGTLKVVHGSRDYFQIETSSAVLEIIPVMRNINPHLAENVTDVSLSHVKYIKKKLREHKDLDGDILLAKSFCRAQRCYGAESYVKGFSGYSLELLVLYFGGFINFLKGIQKKRILDPEKYFRSEREILSEINASKLTSPVILVDPTNKYRNVTAGLGIETFDIFLEASKQFLKNPSPRFFEKQDIDPIELKKQANKSGATLFEVLLGTDRQEGDVAGTKMKKFFDFFAQELGRKGQEIIKKEFDYSGIGVNARGYLIVKTKPFIEIKGPLTSMKEAAEGFKKSRGKSVFENKGRLFAKEKVDVRVLFDSLKKIRYEMGVGAKLF